MSAYSLGGYKIAALARTRKTLMVEGRTDALVMKRLFLELAKDETNFKAPLVDVPNIINEPLLTGLGNRDRVRNVIAAFSSSGDRVAGLIDKEWDGFCLVSLVASSAISPSASLFVTRGHSIENYFFDRDICRDFIARRYADFVEAGFFVAMLEHFDRILDFAFAYSVTLGRRHLVSRAGSLLSPSEVELNHGCFGLSPAVLQKLRARGASEVDVDGFADEVESIRSEIQTFANQADLSRWNCHGHLGDEAIWACIGCLAVREGISLQAAQGIATGYREEWLRSAADAMATNPNYRDHSVVTILEWAKR